MSGLKLGCPIPWRLTAWNNIDIYVSFDAFIAELILKDSPDANSFFHQDIIDEITSFWSSSFLNVAFGSSEPNIFGKLKLPKAIESNTDDLLRKSFLLKWFMLQSQNQVDHFTMARTLLQSNMLNKYAIASAMLGGVVLCSQNQSAYSRLYIPGGLAHAVIQLPTLDGIFQFNWTSESLAFWMQGLFYSNFELLKAAKVSFISCNDANAQNIFDHLLWVFPLSLEGYYWLAASNSHDLELALNLLNEVSGFHDSTTYQTSICKEGVFVF